MKSTKRIYSLLAALAATTTLSLTPSLAADTTDTPSSTAPTYIDITINHVAESTGIEMGDGARARGTGSIATGRNSVAVGKNAVATGGNENKDTITQKLNENKEKLAEIETAQNNVNTLTDDLQTIRAKYADVIEAGTRVKQVQEAKEKARLSWQDKLSAYNTAVDGSKQYLADAQAKIDDLNSRLDGVSKLGSVDISSESGLTTAATQLKSIVEKDTTLNLSQDFYKDYVKSYYQALGDLRQNQIILSNTNDGGYYGDDSEGNSSVINSFFNFNCLSNTLQGITDSGGAPSFYGYRSIANRIFSADTSIPTPSSNLVYKNVDTAVSTLSDWQTAQAVAPQYKAAFKTYFTNTNDRFMTDKVRTALLNQLDVKIDIYVKSNEVTYYQGQYEATKDTTWLDKKKKALDEYNSMVTAYTKLPNAYILRKNAIAAWQKANITDIQDKNKVTTDTLTSELEKALNISKDAITKKQKELADLKTTADQAKTNYEAINPDQKDLYLSAQYDTVMKQLTDKANELKASQDKLDALKVALTLNDLTNTGENAYAIGTDALATGTNAYAIGTSAVATGESSLAIGNGAIATGTQALAVGTGATVFGDHSGAFGDPNTVYGTGSYAIGNDNTLGAIDNTTKKPLPDKGAGTFVVGSNVNTAANHALIFGSNSAVSDNVDYALVLGYNATANNGTKSTDTTVAEDPIVIGHSAKASLDEKAAVSRSSDSTDAPSIAHSLAIGTSATVGEENAVAIGFHSKANALGASSFGPESSATAEGAAALGTNANASGAFSLAAGYNTQAAGEGTVALGDKATGSEKFALAIGRLTKASGEASTAIGNNSQALSIGSVSIGLSAVANGGGNSHSVAIGNGAQAGTSTQGYGETVAIGGGASAQNYYATAIGSNAFAAGSGSVAIGYASKATDSNVVSLGHSKTDTDNSGTAYGSDLSRRLIHVADGQSATDAATVGQTATLGSTNGSVKITKSTNTNGSTNYDLAIDKITADGVIASGNTGILSGGTAYNYLQNAVFYDASAKDLLTFKGASGTKLTNLKDATLSATSTDAVTGRQLYTTNQNISGFADQITKNASKLEDLAKSVTNSLDSVSAMSESVSTIDSTKADASLNNLSDAGKEVISAAATEAVQAYMKNLNGGSAKSTLKTLSAKRYTASPSSLLTTSLFALPATDASSDLSGKADVSYVEEGLSTKADKSTVYTKEETDVKLTGKADTDLKNLSDAGKGVIKNVMKDDLAKKADKTAVAEALTKKADADASNLDTAAYAKKLGTGMVTSGNTDLVTGGTVYTALSKSGIGLVQSDGQVMTVGAKDAASVVDFHNAAGSGRVLTGVTTNASDLTSAANVGYVNSVANGLAQDFTSQIQQTSSMLTRDINKVGAGAAALAGLHPGEYDPADKWDFAAGYGHYKGANASAFGAYYHPNEDTLISLSGTLGNGDPMLSAGVTFKLGSGVSPHTMSRTALTKELNAVQEQNQVLAAQNQQLESDVETLKAQVRQLLASSHTPSK